MLISFPDLRLFVFHILYSVLKKCLKGILHIFKHCLCFSSINKSILNYGFNIWNVFLSGFGFMFGEIGKVKIFSRADDGCLLTLLTT